MFWLLVPLALSVAIFFPSLGQTGNPIALALRYLNSPKQLATNIQTLQVGDIHATTNLAQPAPAKTSTPLSTSPPAPTSSNDTAPDPLKKAF